MENLLIADWVLISLTVAAAVTGLFRGFSGTVAFVAATAAAFVAGCVAWEYQFTDETWIRVLAVMIVSLLAFGLTRIVVRKLVNGLLSQPADSVFGFLCGALLGVAAALLWAYSGFYVRYSVIVGEISAYVNV